MKSTQQEFVDESHDINISQISEASLAHKMSLCSAEVSNISEQRSAVETIAESIDTQILVNTLTKERPKSPPPIEKRRDSDEPIESSIKSGNKMEPNIEELNSCCGKCGRGDCKKCVQGKCVRAISVPCPLDQKDCPLFVEKISVSKPKERTVVQQEKSCPTFVGMVSVSKSHEESSEERCVVATRTSSETVVRNPVPQGYISPMVKALTIASDKPFNAVAIDIETIERSASNPTEAHISKVSAVVETEDYMKKHSVEYAQKSEEFHATASPIPSEQSVKGAKFPHEVRITPDNLDLRSTPDDLDKTPTPVQFPHANVRPPSSSSQFTKALTVAPDKPFSPTPQFSMEPVPLPEETVPYIPKEILFTVEAKALSKRPEVCKSPFVEALTTAPERPYSPIAVTPGTVTEEVPQYIKDLPAPPKDKISMLSALTVATDRPFTPVLFDSMPKSVQIAPVPPPEPVRKPEPPKPVQKKVISSPIPAKPASHLSPSAFTPLGTTKFRPVSETFKPEEKTQPPHAFPPVSQELRSMAKPSGFGSPVPRVEIQNVDAQQSTREVREEQYRRQEESRGFQQYRSSGLQKATHIPTYQRNIQICNTEPPTVQTFDQYEQARESIMPVQKPVTTLQPGQFQPNIPHTSFQPVSEDRETYNGKISHPLPRSVSPSLINKAAPPIPYYQQNLVAQEHLAVESNLYDPKSPAMSRSPSPIVGMSTSPFVHHVARAKSPAQGPPPNPLDYRKQRPATPVHDEKYVEAKESLGSYIPKYQSRVEQKQTFGGGGYVVPPFQSKVEVQKQPEAITTSFQGKEAYYSVAPSQTGYTSYDTSHSQYASQNQYGDQIYNVRASEDTRYMEHLNKSHVQTVETSADNRVQIQRTKRCTEEFERTQKLKTIEIERSSSGVTQVRSGTQIEAGSQGFQGSYSSNQRSGMQIEASHVNATSGNFGQNYVSATSYATRPGMQFEAGSPISITSSGSSQIRGTQLEVDGHGYGSKVESQRPVMQTEGGHSVQKRAYDATMPKSPAIFYPRKTPPPSPITKQQKPVPFGSTAPQSRSYSLPGSTVSKPQSPICSSKQVFQPSTMTTSSRYPPSPLAVSPSPASRQNCQVKCVSKPVAKPVCVPTNQSVSTKHPVESCSNVSPPETGSGGKQPGAIGVSPKRGRGILNKAALPGSRVPLCGHCNNQIRYIDVV